VTFLLSVLGGRLSCPSLAAVVDFSFVDVGFGDVYDPSIDPFYSGTLDPGEYLIRAHGWVVNPEGYDTFADRVTPFDAPIDGTARWDVLALFQTIPAPSTVVPLAVVAGLGARRRR